MFQCKAVQYDWYLLFRLYDVIVEQSVYDIDLDDAVWTPVDIVPYSFVHTMVNGIFLFSESFNLNYRG